MSLRTLSTRRYQFSLLFLIFFLIGSGNIRGQSRVLTLRDCIQAALENSPDFRRIQNSHQAAEFAYQGSMAQKYPDVSVGLASPLNISRSEDKVFISEVNQYNFIRQLSRQTTPRVALAVEQQLPTNGNLSFSVGGNNRQFFSDLSEDRRSYSGFFSLNLNQPLFRLNSYSLNREKAQLSFSQADLDLLTQRNDFIYQVVEKYYDLLSLQNSIDLETKTLEALRLSHQLAKQRMQQGRSTELEVLNSEVAMQSGQLQLIRLQEDYDAAKDEFVWFTGIAENAKIQLDSQIYPGVFNLTLDQTIERALQANPSLQAHEIGIHTSRLSLKETKNSQKPRFDLSTSLDFNNQRDLLPVETSSQFYNWQINLNVSLPVWDGGRRNLAVQAAELNVENQFLSAEKNKQSILQNIKRTYRLMESQKKTNEILLKKLQSAGKAWQLSRERYDEGRLALKDFIDAENNYKTAAREQFDAAVNHNKTVLQLKQLTGMDISQ